MTIKLGLTTDGINTQYAPLAALFSYYQKNRLFAPLDQVKIPMKCRDFTPKDKLLQLFVSMLAGCQTLSEVNQRLKPEPYLAKIGSWPRFADQSGVSRTLDALTLMNIDQLRKVTRQIVEPLSQSRQHDWRGYLWCDFDLSGLPCGKRAEASQKGYFSGKKT